jgi:hypothetical protein
LERFRQDYDPGDGVEGEPQRQKNEDDRQHELVDDDPEDE